MERGRAIIANSIHAEVDILLATYNGEKYICELLDSLVAQSYTAWRLLVSDDGSSDSTPEIVRRYEAMDARVVVIDNKAGRKGSTANFMGLLPFVEASYAMFCDQDDVWLSRKIQVELDALQHLEHNVGSDKPLAVYTDMKVVDTDLNLVDDSHLLRSGARIRNDDLRDLLTRNYIPGCAMMMNRAACQLSSRANGDTTIDWHDWWVAIVCAAMGQVQYVDDAPVLYRQTGLNQVGSKRRMFYTKPNRYATREALVLSALRQAQGLIGYFGDVLPDNDKRMIQDYCSAYTSRSFLDGMRLLNRSGCWRESPRKVLGQIDILARLTKKNRSE